MNALIKAPLDGEVLSGRKDVRLVGRTHPFRQARIDVQIRAGLSIAEILDEALRLCPGSRLSSDFLVHVDGCPVERGWWHLVRPKPGTTITFTPKLGDWRTALSLAVVVAALVLAPYAAGFLAPALWAGAGITYSTTLALAGAGIILAGTLAVNALFPIRPPQEAAAGEGFTALPGVAGAQNQAAPFAPVPVVFGTHRLSPFYGAKPYTELVGDDQYLRMLFVVGYGPLSIADVRIGETPITAFDGVEMETREGFDADDPITLYPAEVDEDALSVTLTSTGYTPGTDDFRELADNEINWETRTTVPGVDQISYDVTAPDGVFHIDDQGEIQPHSIYVRGEYRAVGAEPWTLIGPNIVFGQSTKTARRGQIVTVARGQYEVRIGKATVTSNDTQKYRDAVIWTALRSFKNDHPIDFPKPLALIALRIRATDQLNGVISTLNCVATSKMSAYTGAAWLMATTQNPADHFRNALQGAANARPVADALIDLDSVQAWWTYCRDNGFTFNQVRTRRTSVYDTLADLAAAGRAVPTFIDGKWGVLWDRPDDTIVQHFTPRNSWGFSGDRAYAHLPHGWRVKFINEENGYTEDERIVYDDGYDADNATLFEAIDFPGVTNPALIWKHGRFHIAQARLRPEEISLSTGWENLVCTRGDRVRVTHDVLLIGQVSGRVKSVSGQAVTIDETVIVEAGKTYAFRFRNADLGNRSIIRAVDPVGTPEGEYAPGDAIALFGDLAAIDAGALFGLGETDQDSANYRVKTITHQKDLNAQLVLVDDAPAISQADQGAIPAYAPNVSLPADPYTLPPQHLRYIEVIDLFAAQARALVRLSWTYPRFGRVTAFEVQSKDDTNAGDWLIADSVPVPRTTTDIPLPSPGQWSFRVRCLFHDGTVSNWAVLSGLSLLGLLAPPDDVDNFISAYDNFNRIFLSWTEIEEYRPFKYELRKGTSWDSAQTAAEVAHSPYGTIGDGQYWIAAFISAVTGTRVYSATKRSITILDSVLTDNIVLSKNELDEGFLGSFTGTANRGSIGGNLVIRTGGAGNILAIADILATPSILNYGGQADGFYASPHIVNLGRVMPFRSSVAWVSTGIPDDQNLLADPDILANPDVLSGGQARLVDCYPVMRMAASGPPDVFSSVDVFAETDVFEGGFTWGAWQRWTPDVQNAYAVQFAMVLETEIDTVIAVVQSFAWTVDVEDRLDRYTNLTVPPGGLAVVFEPGGYDAAADGSPYPFIGGSNGPTSLPHVSNAHRNPETGDAIRIADLTLSGCTVHVMSAGTSAGGDEVDLFVQGY